MRESFDSGWQNVHTFRAGNTFPWFQQQQNTMKTRILTAAIAFPVALALASCETKETTTEEMSSGADKVAEGVKEMADSATEATKEAAAEAEVKIDAAVEEAAGEIEEAADKVEEEAKDAAE